jgi:RimJ/RimL family protein N-acetyltransferase
VWVWEELTPRLEGERVVLEPLAASHEERLFEALNHAVIWEWMPMAHPDRAGFSEFFAFLLNEVAGGRAGTFVTVERESGMIVGTSSYLALRPAHRGLEIGMTMVSPLSWGTGANVEAKLLMLANAFDSLDCIRVEFKTDSNNERSRGALAALPAEFEGIFRRHMLTNYGVRDSAYYSVIADEWPSVRANLERRLG